MIRSLRRIVAIARKELQQLRRDRLTFGMIVGIPVMQMVLFGYAINTDVRHLSTAVADLSRSQASAQLIADAQATQIIDVVQDAEDAGELLALLRRGEIAVGILIPEDFQRRIQNRRKSAATLFVDGTDPVVMQAARALTNLPLVSAAKATVEPIALRVFFNPERRTAVNIVPALTGVILTMTMVIFTSMAIVRERERGNLEMLIATPLKTPELMLGKILPYIFVGLLQVSLVLWVGQMLFAVPISGAFLDIFLASLTFIAACLALGLLISTIAQTQFQAMQMAFFIFLPSILLSGFMFPFDGMPKLAQQIAEYLPLTHFVRLIRGVMLRGADLHDLIAEIYALILFAGVALTIAMLRFKKRLD